MLKPASLAAVLGASALTAPQEANLEKRVQELEQWKASAESSLTSVWRANPLLPCPPGRRPRLSSCRREVATLWLTNHFATQRRAQLDSALKTDRTRRVTPRQSAWSW